MSKYWNYLKRLLLRVLIKYDNILGWALETFVDYLVIPSKVKWWKWSLAPIVVLLALPEIAIYFLAIPIIIEDVNKTILRPTLDKVTN